MKAIHFFYSILFIAFLQYSCTDPCEEVVCQNGGTCIEGTCDCPEGFIGPNCEVRVDPCESKQCVNADTCVVSPQGEARCFCSLGFEGERCDSTWSNKYTGIFEVTESCDNSNFYEVEIVDGPRFNEVTVINFNDRQASSESRVVLEAINASSLNIRDQFMEFGKVSGIGSFLNYNRFTLDYTVIQNGDTLSCSAVLDRKF